MLPFVTSQVKLYADYEYDKLMPYLRAMSSYYSFEKVSDPVAPFLSRANIDAPPLQAYEVCKECDYVPEMVFLLGRVGDNKKALNLIIARLGDVERVSCFVLCCLRAKADEALCRRRQSTLQRSRMTMSCGKICSNTRRRSLVSVTLCSFSVGPS